MQLDLRDVAADTPVSLFILPLTEGHSHISVQAALLGGYQWEAWAYFSKKQVDKGALVMHEVLDIRHGRIQELSPSPPFGHRAGDMPQKTWEFLTNLEDVGVADQPRRSLAEEGHAPFGFAGAPIGYALKIVD